MESFIANNKIPIYTTLYIVTVMYPRQSFDYDEDIRYDYYYFIDKKKASDKCYELAQEHHNNTVKSIKASIESNQNEETLNELKKQYQEVNQELLRSVKDEYDFDEGGHIYYIIEDQLQI
jgi:hypothetical protein